MIGKCECPNLSNYEPMYGKKTVTFNDRSATADNRYRSDTKRLGMSYSEHYANAAPSSVLARSNIVTPAYEEKIYGGKGNLNS